MKESGDKDGPTSEATFGNASEDCAYSRAGLMQVIIKPAEIVTGFRITKHVLGSKDELLSLNEDARVLRVFTNLLRPMRPQSLSRYESSLEIVYASIGQSFTVPGIENPRNVRTPRRLDISYIFSKPCCNKQRALLLS